jgi:hypothetical protein
MELLRRNILQTDSWVTQITMITSKLLTTDGIVKSDRLIPGDVRRAETDTLKSGLNRIDSSFHFELPKGFVGIPFSWTETYFELKTQEIISSK